MSPPSGYPRRPPTFPVPSFLTTDDPVQTSKAEQDFDALLEKVLPIEEALKEEVGETFRHLASRLIHFAAPEKMRTGLRVTLECHATKSLGPEVRL